MRTLWSDRPNCSHNVSQKVKRIRRFSEKCPPSLTLLKQTLPFVFACVWQPRALRACGAYACNALHVRIRHLSRHSGALKLAVPDAASWPLYPFCGRLWPPESQSQITSDLQWRDRNDISVSPASRESA